jgi:hypothetical protein
VTAFAGIDYDTHAVHIVLVPEEGTGDLRYSKYELKGHDPFERAREIREALPVRSWWRDTGVVGCAIEEQNSGNPLMRDAVQKLKMIQGAVLSCLPRDLLVTPIPGSQWRKALGMKGNCTKEEVQFWCRFSGPHAGRFAGISWPQDAFDAYCMALVAEKLTVLA